MPRKIINKPYNNGTMSSTAFFGMLRSALRQSSRWWKPITECKKAAKRPYIGENKRQKFCYECNKCKQCVAEKEISIDHIIPAGSLKEFNHLPGFTKRLFVEINGLQALCSTCHNVKTKKEKNNKLKVINK